MRGTRHQSAERIERTLEREMTMVREAIAMVAIGASPRVVLGGLRFSAALIANERQSATEAGVRVAPLRRPDDTGTDIAVERTSACVKAPRGS
jgi:hypothetical protein